MDSVQRYLEGTEPKNEWSQQKVPLTWVHAHLRLMEQRGAHLHLLGSSTLGKPIYRLCMGTGPLKVLLWTQMHGNESTATRALVLLWTKLRCNKEKWEAWSRRYSLRFLPVINPDGASLWTRENALGIDINRDARRRASVEARLLAQEIEDFKPHIAFNLHDQQIYYGAGNPPKQAAISLMAPPADWHEDWPEHRLQAAAASLKAYQWLKDKGFAVGRWNDSFEPRAFGEFAQKGGAATLLIEAGGLKDDPEKLLLTRLYAELLEFLLDAWPLKNTASSALVAAYMEIPLNTRNVFDLVLRGVILDVDRHDVVVDIGMRSLRKFTQEGWLRESTIDEIGDLGDCIGIKEIAAKDICCMPIPEYSFKSLENVIVEVFEGKDTTRVNSSLISNFLEQLSAKQRMMQEDTSSQWRIGMPATMALKQGSVWVALIFNGQLIQLNDSF